MKLLLATKLRVVQRLFVATTMLSTALLVDAATLTVSVLDKTGASVADAVVFAVPVGARPVLKVTGARIDQVNKEFDPLVSVIQTGTPVTFPNRDDVRHHVYSFSPAKPFELKLYSGKPAQPVVFDKPGVVVLGCNIHDWMVAYVVVVDTPYFGKSDAAGKVKLDGLPPGDYDVKVWHFRVNNFNEMIAERRLTLTASSAATTFNVELKPLKPVAAPSK